MQHGPDILNSPWEPVIGNLAFLGRKTEQFGRKTHSEQLAQLGCCATHLRRYKCNVSPTTRGGGMYK